MSDVTFTNNDSLALKNLSQMGQYLKKLKEKRDAAEASFKQAEKEYEYYATTVLPMEMFNVGATRIDLIDGGVIRYEQKYYCQPNKNEEDKRIMAQWLREHGGEDLVKEKAAVDRAQIDALKDAGIPYTEIDDINTQSLKAFLRNNVGIGFSIDEIPNCMHFKEVSIAEIDL